MNDTGISAIPKTEWIWLLFAFALPLTIVSEGVMILGVVVWLVTRRRDAFRDAVRVPFFWPMVVFILIATASVLWSVRPEVTLGRLHRLIFPFAMLAIGGVFASTEDNRGAPALRLALSFVAGCCVRGAYDLVRVPVEVSRGVELFDTGNMRDPQMYMAGLCLILGLSAAREWRRRWPVLAAGILLSGAGLVLHFKRGVWFSFIAAMGLMGIRGRRWRLLLVLGAGVLVALAFPEVRHRLAKLEEVFHASTGGRIALWRDAAPNLIPAYPQGMGWSAVTHEDLAQHTEYLQPKLNHLHNNLLHVALETGWAGLVAWLGWMGGLVWMAFRQSAHPESGPERALGAGILCAVAGLLLNGMVEYNFGDTEILMLYCLLGGLVVAQSARFGPGFKPA